MHYRSFARTLHLFHMDHRLGLSGLFWVATAVVLWASSSFAQTLPQEKNQTTAPELQAESKAPDDQTPVPESVANEATSKKKKKGKKQKKLKGRALEKKIETLPEQYRKWVEGVRYIISDEELRLFVEIKKDYQRDAFIERFWKVRDPYPDSARNEFRENYNIRLREAREYFNGKFDDRTRVLLTNGYPTSRIEIRCKPLLSPTEVWYYDGSETVGFEFLLLFHQKWGAGDFRLWEPRDGLQDLALQGDQVNRRSIETRCKIQDSEALFAALSFIQSQGGEMGWPVLVARITSQPDAPQKEWVQTFATYTTELPEGAVTFDAEMQVEYPGRHQGRTVVQGAIAVAKEAITPVVLAGGLSRSYNVLLTGEILKDGALFDNFRYQFDFPVEDTGDLLPLVFQRNLRAGDYTLMVKVEDLGSGAFHRSEQIITVPRMDLPPPAVLDERTASILKEANAALRDSDTTVKIVPLTGEWQTGLVRVDTLTTGSKIDKVSFFLDDQQILTKRQPPFNVELDLGDVPRSRVLRVETYDEEGKILASDESLLNSGDHRFDIRLEEPHPGRTYRRSLRAEANVIIPKGEVIEKVEFYLNETKVSTLFQEPWVQPIVLPEGDPVAYVRAAAFTPDGAMAEDLVFINAPDHLEEIDVELVELYTLILDRDQRPVLGLGREHFSVFEDGVPQELVRFELVENLPIHAAIMLDVSASMEGRLNTARDAAVTFFEQAITPKDRATTITFNDHPHLTSDFTNDMKTLAAGLAGVKAERGTSLYDAMIFSLYYFNGIRGQRAILLLSDGKDESSKFEFDDVLEYARRSGVSIYTIGLQLSRGELDARRKLKKLAEETGGRSFFLDDVQALDDVYLTIQKELRSRYLITYQSSNVSGSQGFRQIEVRTLEKSQDAKTLRGYYP